MMPEKFNDRWEEEIKKVIPKVIDSVKKDLEPNFKELQEAQSVTRDSFLQIESANDSNNYLNEQSNNDYVGGDINNQRAKVRVLNKQSNYIMPNSSFSDKVDNDHYNVGSFTEDNNHTSTLGSVTTLILICTAILVVLVVAVTLFAMNYMGF